MANKDFIELLKSVCMYWAKLNNILEKYTAKIFLFLKFIKLRIICGFVSHHAANMKY